MTIVVDVTAIIAVITNESRKFKIIERTRGNGLMAPGIIELEILKTTLNMMRRQWLRRSQVSDVLDAFQNIPIRTINLDTAEVAELAMRLNISANDAAYIHTALKYKSPLLTLDDTLKIAANKVGIKVLEV